MSTTEFLYSICSENRTSGNSNDFVITTSEPLQHVSEIEIYSAQISHTFYNVSTALNNNTFILSEEGELDQTINIKDGHYDINYFVSVISERLNPNIAFKYTVSYNRYFNKITISNVQAIPFSISFKPNTKTHKLFGFSTSTNTSVLVKPEEDDLIQFKPYTAIVSNNSPDLKSITQIHILCPEFGMCPVRSLSNPDFMSTFVLSSLPSSIHFHNQNSSQHADQRLYCDNKTISNPTFKLFDQNGRPLELNGGEWNIIIKVRQSIPSNDVSSNDIPSNDVSSNDILSNDIPSNDIPSNDTTNELIEEFLS